MTSDQTHFPRRFVLAAGGALALAGCGPREAETPAAPAPDDPAARPPGPRAAPGRIVTLFGDSITAGYGLKASDSLPAQLERAVVALGVPVRVRAAGVSGDTTAGGLARVDFSVQDDTDLCIVALGGNDLLQGVDPGETRRNLDQIIKRLQARHIPVLLAGMRAPPQYGAWAREFDQVFVDLAHEDNVPLYPFLLEGVALDRRYNQADGIHPNPVGVKIIAARLAPVVARVLAPATPS
ncbi:arylesterase [Brevundimonas goettingensis]|uniref:Arylesterase n=1 Tax=Brevundimonas goettingensis TaxID=2774190 RepID=A0A975C4S0_9CAUL|nr:arylesterase [Brevundimonas goettingensis]QTC92867.1 arylesterase [Brevundimonas goettingensis]